MPKYIKNLDFQELVRQPGFEWIRLYFEKYYANKNFIIEPYYGGPIAVEESVYYLFNDTEGQLNLRFKGKQPLSMVGWRICDSIVDSTDDFYYLMIKIRVI